MKRTMHMNPAKRRRGGFTLIEIIVAMAILAVLAGAITPLVFRELVSAREEATQIGLDTLESALLDFYEDTGRFPTAAEGLAALVVDPGLDGWQGPYVSGDTQDPFEIGEDGFGNAYLYDPEPVTDPVGAADVIVASGGSDHTVSFGSVGGIWNLGDEGDDLLALVNTGPLDRDKLKEAQRELHALGEAAFRYFEEQRAFTTDPVVLVDGYLDDGAGADPQTDPWRNAYVLSIDTSGDVPELAVRSFGPDRADDGGADDDLTVTVGGLAPGRKTTNYLLAIAQTVLNQNPGLALSSDWNSVRASLGLEPAFSTDGWGRSFGVNVTSRTVFSAGPDGNGATTSDNLPMGVGP